MGGVLLKAQHTLNLHIFSMSTCHEHFSFVPHSPSLFSLFKTTAVLRESLSVTAEKGKPTNCCCAFPPQSPPPLLLFSSYLFSFFPISSLFLLRQALQVGRHMTKLTQAFACTFWICNPANVGINQKRMSCSIKKDSICNTEGQREGKSKRKRQTA